MGNGFNAGKARDPHLVEFHPISESELSKHPHTHFMGQLGLGPKHRTFICGTCGDTTNGRVLCEVQRKIDNRNVLWCVCSCDKSEPTVLFTTANEGGQVHSQIPIARDFHAAPEWPPDLIGLYEEAAKSYAAGAYTAASMVCRKILMSCACEKGAAEGLTFAAYVDYITANVLAYPQAKASIDVIRSIGNEANHHVTMVNQVDACRAMKIVTYMLNTIYSLPSG